MVTLLTGKRNKKFVPKKRKKVKAANCIFLTEERICQNKESHKYLSKCFEATYCTYRIKEKNQKVGKKNNVVTSENYKSYRKKGLQITHCIFGKGQIESVKGKHAVVQFEKGQKIELDLEYCANNKIIY